MNVLVDTSVWSLALRRVRSDESAQVTELAELVREGRIAMIGPIRQELLSGIKLQAQFEELRKRLAAFQDLPLVREDFEEAASAHNRCRRRGIQGSHTDYLICAVAARRSLSIFTTDGDFEHYRRVLQVPLHRARS